MTNEEKLGVGFVFAGLTGVLIWSLIRGKTTPKYKVPFEVWGCDELCRCDELFLQDVRYSNGQWEYWLPYPENVWVPESHIDEFIAQGQRCGSAAS